MPKACAPLWSVVGWSPAVANGVLYVARVAHTFEVRAYDAAGVTKCGGSPKTCAPLWVGDTGINPDVLPAVTSWVAALDSKDPNYERWMLEGLWTTWGQNRVDEALLHRLMDAKDYRVRAACVVSTTGVWPDTVTLSSSAPTPSCTLMLATKSAGRFTASRLTC